MLVSLSFPPLTHLAHRVRVIYLPRTCIHEPPHLASSKAGRSGPFPPLLCFRVLSLSPDRLTTNRACGSVVRLPGFALLCFRPLFLFASADRLMPRLRQPFYTSTPATSVLAIANHLLVSPMPQDRFASPHTVQHLLRVLARLGSRPVSSRTTSDSLARSPPSSLQFRRL